MRNRGVEHDHSFGSCSARADPSTSTQQPQVSDRVELFAPGLCCQVLGWRQLKSGLSLLTVFPTWMFLCWFVFEYQTELQVLMFVS